MNNKKLYKFIKYCSEGDLQSLKRFNMLSNFINLEYITEYGDSFTPLIISIYSRKNNKFDIIEFLLQKGADPNLKCKKGLLRIPMHLMIYSDFEISDFTGEDLNSKGIELLIKYGADINIKDKTGRTPLDVAMLRGHIPAEDMLKKYGAKNSEIFFKEDYEEYKRKIHYLIRHCNFSTKNLFNETEIDLIIKKSFKQIDLLIERGFDINYLTEILGYGEVKSPFHIAVMDKANIKILECLLERGANINLEDGKDNTPLDLAMIWDNSKSIDFLLENGAKNSKNFESDINLLDSLLDNPLKNNNDDITFLNSLDDNENIF